MTVYMTKLRRWDTTVISRLSLTLKQILAAYISLIWIYCIYNMITESSESPNKQDIYVVILEWNSVLINLVWVLTMVMEWKDLDIVLSVPK